MSKTELKKLEDYTKHLFIYRQKDRKPKGNKIKKEGAENGA